MPSKGFVKDPETGTFHPGHTTRAQEIIAAREAARNPPTDPNQTIIDDYMANESELAPPPTWLGALLAQMKEDTSAQLAAIQARSDTQMAAIQAQSDIQIAAIQLQNSNLIAALNRSRTPPTLPVQPAQPVTIDNANLTLTKELKASDIGSFKPLDLADASNTQLFIDEIDDAVEHYSEARVIPALHKCLGNDLAQTWFASLSYAEKTSMRALTGNFKAMLRRCYMGSPSDLRLLADKETFNWNQDRTPMEYLLAKTQKLRIVGCTNNDELVARV